MIGKFVKASKLKSLAIGWTIGQAGGVMPHHVHPVGIGSFHEFYTYHVRSNITLPKKLVKPEKLPFLEKSASLCLTSFLTKASPPGVKKRSY